MKKLWAGLLPGLLLLTLTACGEDQALLADEQTAGADANNESEQVEETVEKDFSDEMREQSENYMKEPDFEVITPNELYHSVIFEDSDDYLILDVRDTSTFVEGNIPGSVNIPYRITGQENMLENLPKDKKIYVICFSGHTASHTVGMLNALGFDAQTLEFGMGGYAAGTELGASIPGGPAGFDVVTDGFESEETYEIPEVLYTSDMSVDQVMMAQAQMTLDKEMPAVMGAPDIKEMTEKGELGDYQLIDIRLADHYAKGHVPMAVNMPYDELFENGTLEMIDPDKTTIVIGYNGYDASQASRLLNQLNYKAVPMAYGMSLWSGDEDVIGKPPFDFQAVKSLPTQELKFDLDGGDVSASCS